MGKDRRVEATPRGRRPAGVTLLATLVGIGVVLVFASAGFALYSGNAPVVTIGWVLFVVGIVYIVAAIALRSPTSGSWWLALIASAVVLASSTGLMVLLGRISFWVGFDFPDIVLNGLSFGLPIALFLLALIILVSLVALRGHFAIGAKVAA